MNSNEIQTHDQPIAIDKENKNINEDLEQDLFQNISYDGKNIIDSVACSKAVCFATGNQIQLYNESYTEHLATVTLDCTPEHLCVSRDENFIIIADNMGRIHFFHLQSKNIIFSQQIVEPSKHSKSSCFLSLCFNVKKEGDIEELFIILRDYSLLKASNINLIKLEESINNNDLSLAQEIKKNITIETIDIGQTVDSPHHQSINDMVIYKSKGKENIIIAGSGKYSLSVWSYSPLLKKTIMRDAIGDILLDVEILKIKVDEEGKYLFALDVFKRLLIFSLEWLILLYKFSNTDIIDFCILPNDGSSEAREIIVLAEHKMKKIKRYLEIIQIPGYHVLHRIEINRKSWLIKNHNSSRKLKEKEKLKEKGKGKGKEFKEEEEIDFFKNELFLKDLYFIEENSNLENTVNIRSISEIIPINQFQYMINNKKYDEALNFAEKNNLNKQIVLKPKLTDQLERINSNLSSSEKTYNLQQILEDLSQIDDLNFVIQFCLDVNLSTYDDTVAILSFANQLIQNYHANNTYENDNDHFEENPTEDSNNTKTENDNSNDTNNNNDNNNNNNDNNNSNNNNNYNNNSNSKRDSLLKDQKVQQAIKRLGTYILIKKGNNLTKGRLFNSKEWQIFKNSDIIEDIKQLFYYGKISLGIILWRRHLTESKKDLIYNICDILDNIPIEVPVEEYIKWLKYEVLTILSPDERSYIYIWIEQRARLVENYEKSPHNALKLMKLIDNNKTMYDSFETVFSSKYKKFIAPTPMHHVDNIILLAHTSSYSIFKNKATIEFMEENKLKHQLQDLVYLWDVHNYKISLEKYDQSEPEGIAFDMLDKVVASELLDKTIKEHFIPYVNKNNINKDKLLSDYCLELMDQTTATTFDVSMEERILTILKNITDNEFKVKSLLEFLRRISVPWSNEVNDMILEMLIVPNKRLNELKGQYRLMQFKLMLLDYEIKSYNISKISMAKGLIKYILSFTKRPNAIDDAIQVINTYHHLNSYDAYIIRIINLCREERLSEVLYLIRNGRENEDSQRNRNNKDYPKFNIDHFVEKKLKDHPEKVEELENTLYEIFYGEEDHYTLEDGIMIGRNIIRWLVESMEEIFASITDQGYIIVNQEYPLSEITNSNSMVDQEELEEAIAKYRWIIQFVVAILNLIMELEEEYESKSQDSRSSRINLPYTTFNGWSEDFKLKIKKAKNYFENINILFNEFGVMISWKSYQNKEFRKNLLIKFTRLSLSQSIFSSDGSNTNTNTNTNETDGISTSTNTNTNVMTNSNTNTNIIFNDSKKKEENPIRNSHSSSSLHSMSSYSKNKENSTHTPMVLDKETSATSDSQEFIHEKQLGSRKRSSNNLLEISDLFNDNYSNLYRFSEILCIPRNELKGILAMEATAYGDYEVAILQGKELYRKNKNKETAHILRSLIKQIISNSLSNSISFKNIKKNDRFTTQIQYISQKALTICDETKIDEYLNVFKNCELLNFVFSQCDSGDYTTLIRNNIKENEQSYYNQNSSSSSYSIIHEEDEESCCSSSNSKNNYYSNIFKFVHTSVKKQKQYHTNDEKYLTEKYGNSIFAEQYQEHFLILNTEKAMTMCMDFILSNKISFDQEFSKKNKKADYDPRKSGHELITYLLSNKCVMSSLYVANLLFEYIYRRGTLFGENYIDQVDINSYSHLIKISLENTLYSRQIDEHLLLGYLLCLPMNKAANIFKAAIKSLDNDYYRTIKFASIGALVGRVWNQRNFQVGCLEAGKHAKWFYQFKCLGIPFSQSLFKNSENNDYQRSLVSCFLLKSNLDIFTVLEFARNYHIEDDFVILEYIKLMLIEKDSEVTNDYQSKIVGVIDEIANKEKLLAMLTDVCLPQVSPYDYEKLQFIYEQMDRLIGNEETIKKHLMVLEILSSYTRTLPPNKEEFQIYLEINIDNNRLEELINQYPLCKSRLSFFSLIKSPWKILSPELTDEGNLPKLLPLRIPLDIPMDEFFIRIVDVVIKKMTDEMNQHSQNKNYVSKYKFSDIKLYLLKCTPSHTIIEKTIYAANKFPTGIERIEGYQLSLYIVDKYLEMLNQQQEKDEKSIEECNNAKTNINYWLSITKTEYQMISVGYHDFVSYCTNPTELIIKLYEQKSIDVLMGKDNIDLHGMVSEIADRHGLNIEKIRQTLIQKWISKEPTYTQEEKEKYLPSMRIWMNNLSLDATPNSESRIQMILLYIFRSGQKKQRIKTLLNPICKSTKLKHHIRIRALSILFQLASPDELNEFIEYNKLRNYMQTCLYLEDFEDLNIHQSSVEFESCDKKSLVKSLLLHHYNEPKVAQIICNICMDYQIYDKEIWDNVIRQLIDSKCYVYLLDILDYVSTIPKMIKMKSLIIMGNEVITECLKIYRDKFKSYPLSLDTVYIKILDFISRCPFILELDIESILNLFKEIVNEAYHSLQVEYKSSFIYLISGLSGICVLPLLPSVQNTFVEILSSLSSETLISILDYFYKCENESSQLCDNFDFNYVFRLIKNGIYEVIMNKNEYHILVNTRYIDDLINYCINNDNIQNILLLSLKNRMYQTALNIVTSYYQKYEEKLNNIENISEDVPISKLFLLKKYIKDHHEFKKEKTLIDNVFNELEHKSSS